MAALVAGVTAESATTPEIAAVLLRLRAADTRGVVRHLIEHAAIGVLEISVVLEEVAVAEDVRHHQLLLHDGVRLDQIRVTRVVVDHQLVDLR